jgi:CheY-like chemotaxis protein
MQGLSILVVEDEALIRMMVVEMLEELGHRVVAEAGSIATAEPLARSCAFDLAILDINVAGDNIGPIAEIIAQRGLPFALAVTVQKGRPAMFNDKPVLRKPFLISDIATMIKSALSLSASPSVRS